MFFWYSAGNRQCYFSGCLHGRWKTDSNDSGLTVSQYHSLWDVYFPGQSYGSGGYGSGSRGFDASAVYACAGRHLDSYKTYRVDWRPALSYQ